MQTVKQKGSTFVYNGSNDVAMVKMRKEAAAQGVDTVKVWACSLACYTPNFIQSGGKDVEGTYVTLQFLPFEDAGSNDTLDAYLAAVGGPTKGTSWGASAWAAADEFKAVADKIVDEGGPNAITRAKFLDTIKDFNGYDDNGFIGTRDQRQYSDCMVVLQVQNGKFVRVQPTEAGQVRLQPRLPDPSRRRSDDGVQGLIRSTSKGGCRASAGSAPSSRAASTERLLPSASIPSSARSPSQMKVRLPWPVLVPSAVRQVSFTGWMRCTGRSIEPSGMATSAGCETSHTSPSSCCSPR